MTYSDHIKCNSIHFKLKANSGNIYKLVIYIQFECGIVRFGYAQSMYTGLQEFVCLVSTKPNRDAEFAYDNIEELMKDAIECMVICERSYSFINATDWGCRVLLGIHLPVEFKILDTNNEVE